MDNKLNTAQIVLFVFDKTENIIGKRGNAGNQHFLFFQQMFSTGSKNMELLGKDLMLTGLKYFCVSCKRKKKTNLNGPLF